MTQTPHISEDGVGVVTTQVIDLKLPPEGLRLKCGQYLPAVQVAYESYGDLSEQRDNVIFVCHALTGDAHVAGRLDTPEGPVGWWDPMIGPGRGIDTNFYHVICANILGGCRGTTGPASLDPRTGKPYGSTFPPLAVEDIVDVHYLLLTQLGIDKIAAVIGGSFGGMQVLDWMLRYPDRVGRGICIASASSLSAQALAFDIVGRTAITHDPNWQQGDYYASGVGPSDGLALARKVGHITYLSPGMMTHKFGRDRRDEATLSGDPDHTTTFHSNFQVESYLEHQGAKFVQRFDANSYLHITRALDEYEIAPDIAGLEAAFARIKAKVLIVALSDDWLFPPEQSWELAHALLHQSKAVSYCHLHAPHGHDAFLVSVEHLSEVVRAFLPWVRSGGQVKPIASTQHRLNARRREFELIAAMVPQGGRLLDLGCGDGEMLTFLREQRQTTGLGVDIDIGHLIRCMDDGHDMLQINIDKDLGIIPDNSYDCVILSQTLQVIHHPLPVLREMLRIAPQALVSFPNFANWNYRLQLACGRMPKGGALPYEWHETPNIHLFTLLDFTDLCRREGFGMDEIICLPESRISRLLVRLGRCNLGADRVLMRITRNQNELSRCCKESKLAF